MSQRSPELQSEIVVFAVMVSTEHTKYLC